MSNLEPHKETITYLILKYGSMQKAFIEWMDKPYDTFTEEEHEAIKAHYKVVFPNLKLVRTSTD